MICERQPQVDVRKLPRDIPANISIRNITVSIVKTPCNLGGHRNWFLCPSCERRCAILYPVSCRLCIKGRYETELESYFNRRLSKVFKIRARLGQHSNGIIPPFPSKPKWMRWHTYLSIRTTGQLLEKQIWSEASRVL